MFRDYVKPFIFSQLYLQFIENTLDGRKTFSAIFLIKETQWVSGLLTDPCVFHAALRWCFEFLSHGESKRIVKSSVGWKITVLHNWKDIGKKCPRNWEYQSLVFELKVENEGFCWNQSTIRQMNKYFSNKMPKRKKVWYAKNPSQITWADIQDCKIKVVWLFQDAQ